MGMGIVSLLVKMAPFPQLETESPEFRSSLLVLLCVTPEGRDLLATPGLLRLLAGTC